MNMNNGKVVSIPKFALQKGFTKVINENEYMIQESILRAF